MWLRGFQNEIENTAVSHCLALSRSHTESRSLSHQLPHGIFLCQRLSPMVLLNVEGAVTSMVRRRRSEVLDVQQKYGFELVDDTLRWLKEQVDAVSGGACEVADGRDLVRGSGDANSGVANGLSMALVCCMVRVLVARSEGEHPVSAKFWGLRNRFVR